jgi:hypothetical protein
MDPFILVDYCVNVPCIRQSLYIISLYVPFSYFTNRFHNGMCFQFVLFSLTAATFATFTRTNSWCSKQVKEQIAIVHLLSVCAFLIDSRHVLPLLPGPTHG